ncbi:PocR ligand-binding domain-containing protein [Solidesulfovibrio sp. C21]|uniref:PocR ligand-binding domain-containing protein n=1 Tax=Solidesulfovibrio sp. C21 TaxID=3398613 RepID=UPI0039FD2F6A
MESGEQTARPQRPGQVILLRELESLRDRIRELEADSGLYPLGDPPRPGFRWPGTDGRGETLTFQDIFNVEAIQEIQDAFAAATNVASIITDTEGRPLTRPSRFCRLCREVVRRTPKGLSNCIRSDASFGSTDPLEPIMRPCLSSGLWDGGTSIYAGERHVANWVVGQVRIETGDDDRAKTYAAEIGADEARYMEALAEVPVMTRDQFLTVCRALCLIAHQISSLAEKNYLQAQAIELRRRAEQALRESEERFRQLSEATFEGIFIHQGGTIVDANKAGCAMFGQGPAALIGREVETLLAPTDRDQDAPCDDAAGADACLARFVGPGGQERTCEVRERDIAYQGGAARVLAVRDITERVLADRAAKEKQQQLIQADKMVSLGVLVAGMAHEINNPNSFMTLNLPMLQEIWEDITPILEAYYRENGDFLAGGLEYSELRDMLPDLLARMYEGATRIRGIVGSLKNFSRRAPDDFKWDIDVSDVVRNSLELVDNLVAKSTNRFTVSLAEGLPAVTANPQKLSQVVINLLVNACEALTCRDQAIRVETLVDPGDGSVVVRVTDAGSGIAPEIVSKIMDPFFTTKRETGGTGLGLSVSSNIVEEHGGRLVFASEPGAGTRVEMRLPVCGRGREGAV